MKKCQILLLHGWNLSGDRYSPLIQQLSGMGYSVFAPDLLGFGKTSLLKKPLFLDDYVSFIDAFIKNNKIVRPIIIGHSFGGRVAVKYISTKQTDTKALILTGTPGYTSVKKVKWVVLLIISKIGNMLCVLPGLKNIADKIRAYFYYIVGARDYYRAQGSMRQTFKNIVGERLENYMKTIHIPTLLIWGEEDIIVPVKIAKRMNETIKNSKLIIIPHGKHSVIIDDPETFAKVVCSFL